MIDSKREIANLVSQGKTEAALRKLRELAESLENQEQINQVLLLQGTYQEYKRNVISGVLNDSTKSSKLNSIHQSLLAIMDEPLRGTETSTPRPQQTTSIPQNSPSPSNSWKKWLGGIVTVIAVLAGLAEFTGINLSTLFGAKPDDPSLQLTVYVHGSKGRQDIILESQGEIVLDFGNRRETRQIGEDGRTNFSEIDSRFLNDTIGLHVVAEGFEVAKPKAVYVYNGKPIYVEMKAVSQAQTPIADNPTPKNLVAEPRPGGSSTPSKSPPPQKPQATALTYLTRDLSSSKADLTIMVLNRDNSMDPDLASRLQDYYQAQKLSVAPSLLKYAFVK
ncbi:MAG: hypothetical protein AAGM67_11040, partial [Bacteroidota bacterium]